MVADNKQQSYDLRIPVRRYKNVYIDIYTYRNIINNIRTVFRLYPRILDECQVI